MDHLKKWLDCDDVPGNFYELLDQPLLCPDRTALLGAVRATNKFLHDYQNHHDPDKFRRARRLQLLSAKAEHTFSEEGLWKSYDRSLLTTLQALLPANSRKTGEVRQWLREAQRVATERLDEVVGLLTETERPPTVATARQATASAPASTNHRSGNANVETRRSDAATTGETFVPGNPPFSLGAYEVLERLGEGGIGIVYKARHTHLHKLVALKLLRSDRPLDKKTVARFQREIRAIGQLDHQNIVRATDAGEFRGVLFLAMDLIDGRNLHDVVQLQGPLPPREACDLVRQTALGLQHAHERGLIHRDIKPSNLMIAKDKTVKILDLGLAQLASQQLTVDRATETADRNTSAFKTELTSAGMILGTIDYMAPEQAWDKQHLDARSDIYSLGCTLFFLLTGSAPYRLVGDNSLARIAAHASAPIPKVSQFRQDVPRAVDDVLNRMLAKAPADRFQTAGEVAAALDRAYRPAPPPPPGKSAQSEALPVVPPGAVLAAPTPYHPLPALTGGEKTPAKELRRPPPPPIAAVGVAGSGPMTAVLSEAVPNSARRGAASGLQPTTHAIVWFVTGAVMLVTLIAAAVLLAMNL